MHLTKHNIPRILDEIDVALEGIGKKYNLQLKTRRTYGYTDKNFRVEVEGVVVENGVAETREAQCYKQLATHYGLDPNDLYKEFISRGRRFKIMGLKPKNFRYPVVVEELPTGKRFKFSVDAVVEATLFSQN